MKKIEGVEQHIAVIKPKLDIKASDWTKSEKEAIAAAYFKITEHSRGKGRNLDKGCSSCVSGAVTIINNYLFALDEEVEEVKFDEVKPSNDKWRKNMDSISEAASELMIEFPEDCVSKKDRIAFMEKNLAELNA